jgi:hypothetical protein
LRGIPTQTELKRQTRPQNGVTFFLAAILEIRAKAAIGASSHATFEGEQSVETVEAVVVWTST